MRAVAVAMLVGCSGEVEPLARTAAEACGVSEPGAWSAAAFLPPTIESGCAAVLAADFGFAEVPVSSSTREGSALAGAYTLLACDWGVGASDVDAFERSLAEVASITGDEDVGWLAYDYAVARTRRLREAELEEGVSARWLALRRTVEWGEVLPPAGAATALVHEARHADGLRHVDCEVGEVACDADAAGPYGFEAALFRRAEENAEGWWRRRLPTWRRMRRAGYCRTRRLGHLLGQP